MEGPQQDRDAIRAEMDRVQHHRETVQPIREKTGGSTFKNPEGHSAWRLVDQAGMRGATVGGEARKIGAQRKVNALRKRRDHFFVVVLRELVPSERQVSLLL